MKLEAMYTTTLSRKVVVQRVVRFSSRFEGKMDMQPDFPINCEVLLRPAQPTLL